MKTEFIFRELVRVIVGEKRAVSPCYNGGDIFWRSDSLTMTLTPEDVRKVGSLARLALAEDEIERMTRQLNDLLQQFARLQELDTDDVPPTSHAVPVQAHLRDDEIKPSLSRDAVLKLSPNVDEYLGGFIVPQVIGE